MKKYFLLSFLLTIATGFSALAQDHVTVYRDCGYRGSSHNLYEGEYRDRDLGVGNDAISAIRIPRGWKVIVYTDNNFRGTSRTFEESIECMPADINDEISSIRVERVNSYNRPSYGGSSDRNSVTLYVDCDYRGAYKHFGPGTYNANDLGIGNDKLSAIRVPVGMKVTVYMDNYLRGASATYTRDVSCLPPVYNDKVSSIRVENIRGGNNYGNRNNNRVVRGNKGKFNIQSLRGKQIAQNRQTLRSRGFRMTDSNDASRDEYYEWWYNSNTRECYMLRYYNATLREVTAVQSCQ